MYKDKDKQREANRQAQARFKAKQSLAEQGITEKVLPLEPKSIPVIPCDTSDIIPKRSPDINYENGGITLPDKLGPLKPERTAQGNIRVSKPGDADYVPMCDTTRTFVKDSGLCPYCLKRPIMSDNAISCEECSGMMLVEGTAKRGKDIKCFGDLPVDVQEVIHRLSTTDGKIDQTAKANRTAIAINYQHQFPDRYHNTGMSTEGAGL